MTPVAPTGVRNWGSAGAIPGPPQMAIIESETSR